MFYHAVILWISTQLFTLPQNNLSVQVDKSLPVNELSGFPKKIRNYIIEN